MTASAPRYDDDALLKLVGEERKRSIGFGEGDSGELTSARETALAFYKGDMLNVSAEHKVPSLANRSKAVDTTVADAIETVLPDVLEIFVGGEDVATFIPQGEDDEERAQEETDFVQHVVFTENPGFLTLYTAFKDALLTRTGIIHWWWEDEEKEETQAEVSAEQAPMLQMMAEMQGQPLEPEEQDDGTISLKSKTLHGKVCIRAFPSEDFTCGVDTLTNLKEATYCAVRDRPRVQDLIARGIDAEKARALPSYALRNDTVEQARDEAGESDRLTDSATGDLRMVEVRAHYIRLDTNDNGKLEIWRVLTDAEEKVLLEKEKVDHIPFAALTPYIVPHRFYGESVADKLIEVQKIKTVLLRSHLDNIYFALNQRVEVDMSAANEFTIPDLLRNEPGSPVRVARAGALKPLMAGGTNVDTLAAMEYAATMAESRSGIVRNAQGLNPDTLHDTAKGALALISAAQKRVRLIARIFAETGVKDLFLGVHRLLRTGYTADHSPANAKLRNSWKEIKPHEWNERCAMAVHVGVGSAGREHDQMIATQRLELMERLMAMPGAMGSLIDANNIHAGLNAWERAAGSKSPEAYWSDPANAKPEAPKPDPEMERAKAEMDLEREKAGARAELERDKAQAQLETERQRMEMQFEAERVNSERAHELKLQQLREELDMEREKLGIQLENQREIELIKARNNHDANMTKVSASVDQVEAGGEPG